MKMKTKRLLLLVPLLLSCFQPWKVEGLYLCGGGCPEGMKCDDGVCCRETGDPACPTEVPSSGRCAGNVAPKTWYADLDDDGFGNPAQSRLACARPILTRWVEDATDCDDTSAAAHPGGTEACDGRDNDCDQVIDDGLAPQSTYYRDTDGDGFGVLTDTVTACALPPGFAVQSGDCAPMDNARNPNAVELCNNVDDDCKNGVDDAVPGLGASCSDAGLGDCFAGTTACVNGAVVCRSTATPSRDICDGRDNNCNGTADEQPDCGGPPMLLTAGVALIGARDTGSAAQTQASPTQCFGRTVGTGEGWSPPAWSGSSDNFHVWYAEAPGATTWDLSKAGLKLHLQFSTTMLRQNTTNPWNQFNQPIVLVCNANPASFTRYRPQPTTFLGTTANVTVNTDLPLAGGNGWLLAQGGADLTQVKRIEVIVEPSDNGAMIPSFTATFDPSTGFKP